MYWPRDEFTSRKQLVGEGFTEFVTALKEQVVQCNFETTFNERIRDQIIHDAANASVLEKLLAHKENLSLDKVEEIGRSSEALHRADHAFGSENIQRVETSQHSVYSTWQDGRLLPGSHQDGCRLSRGSSGNRGDSQPLVNQQKDQDAKKSYNLERRPCDWCGSTKCIASDRDCPARDRCWNACHTLGHFASVYQNNARTAVQ